MWTRKNKEAQFQFLPRRKYILLEKAIAEGEIDVRYLRLERRKV